MEETLKKRRPIGAVIGSARDDSEGEAEAEALGKALVEAGFRVVSGGLGGIMRAASRGARSSSFYQEGDVIGVLPSYDSTTANEFVDIAICTGLQHARNIVVVATGDIVFAIAGRSGTLSEMAFAWTLGKPILCVGNNEGWATELAGRSIDDRQENQIIYGPFQPSEAVAFANTLLGVARPASKEF